MGSANPGRVMVGVYLDEETARRLKARAQAESLSMSALLQRFAEHHLIDTDFERWTESAAAVLVVGATLHQTLADKLLPLWKQRIQEGTQVRFLMMDLPNEPILEILERVSYTAPGADSGTIRELYRSSLRKLGELLTWYQAEQHALSGTLEAALHQFPPFSLAMIERSSGSQLRVDPLPIKTPCAGRVGFVLQLGDEPFEFYRRQGEKLWSMGRKVNSLDVMALSSTRVAAS